MIEVAHVIRCDHGFPSAEDPNLWVDCEESSGWRVDGVKSLETRLSDEGWIKRGKNLHYCPKHADGHR